MGYEEMAADGGYGKIGSDENRAMAQHLEEMDQRQQMEAQEPDPGDVWADLQCRAETAEAKLEAVQRQLAEAEGLLGEVAKITTDSIDHDEHAWVDALIGIKDILAKRRCGDG